MLLCDKVIRHEVVPVVVDMLIYVYTPTMLCHFESAIFKADFPNVTVVTCQFNYMSTVKNFIWPKI